MKQIATLLSLMLSSKLLLAQTLSDQINNFFEPIVAVMAKVIFWDPIAALGFELESQHSYRSSLVSFWSPLFYFKDEFYQRSWF